MTSDRIAWATASDYVQMQLNAGFGAADADWSSVIVSPACGIITATIDPNTARRLWHELGLALDIIDHDPDPNGEPPERDV